MHSVSCLIPASNTQHVELGRVKEEEEKESHTLPSAPVEGRSQNDPNIETQADEISRKGLWDR
jgi:hypothetical protein